MSRVCELTKKAVLSGNKVSHSNRKTKRKFKPNIRYIRVRSDILNSFYSLKICANALRSVEKAGGLDNYLVKADDALLSDNAIAIKKALMRRIASIAS